MSYTHKNGALERKIRRAACTRKYHWWFHVEYNKSMIIFYLKLFCILVVSGYIGKVNMEFQVYSSFFYWCWTKNFRYFLQQWRKKRWFEIQMVSYATTIRLQFYNFDTRKKKLFFYSPFPFFSARGLHSMLSINGFNFRLNTKNVLLHLCSSVILSAKSGCDWIKINPCSSWFEFSNNTKKKHTKITYIILVPAWCFDERQRDRENTHCI